MSAWLHIVGIGEDGLEGLLPAARAVLQSAQVIIGGDRHHHLAGITSAERLSWPSPFDALISTCLLYTSPSPRDRTRSRMPSSA